MPLCRWQDLCSARSQGSLSQRLPLRRLPLRLRRRLRRLRPRLVAPGTTERRLLMRRLSLLTSRTPGAGWLPVKAAPARARHRCRPLLLLLRLGWSPEVADAAVRPLRIPEVVAWRIRQRPLWECGSPGRRRILRRCPTSVHVFHPGSSLPSAPALRRCLVRFRLDTDELRKAPAPPPVPPLRMSLPLCHLRSQQHATRTIRTQISSS